MSRIKSVLLPPIGSVQLIIKTKREIRTHSAFDRRENETNEWFYWNRVWPSEVALSEWLIREFYPDKLIGKTILELGCGTGLAGIVCAKLGAMPTFSDKVPLVMDSVKDVCELNRVLNYRTVILDWSDPSPMADSYDMVLGSEIFYDERFLGDICELLSGVLRRDGLGIFCDPNRLGVDTLQRSFSKYFRFRVQSLLGNQSGSGEKKPKNTNVFLYELAKKPELFDRSGF